MNRLHKNRDEQIISYLYGEMTTEEKQAFEEVLKTDADLAAEVRELQATRDLLAEAEPLSYAGGGPFSAPSFDDRSAQHKRRSPNVYKLLLAAAAVVILALSASLWIQLDRHAAAPQEELASSQMPQPQERLYTEQELETVVQAVQQQQAVMMAALMDELREEQEQQLTEIVEAMTVYFDSRRNQDLMLISEGLAQLEQETNSRITQTDQVLGGLIYALSTPTNRD
ncbi:MAG: hypothetical protein ACNA78_11945 [Balneolaceae bacterium]